MAEFCNGCPYGGKGEQFEEQKDVLLSGLAERGIEPTGEGREERMLSSPFKTPWPDILKMCCVDAQLLDQLVPSDEQRRGPARAIKERFETLRLETLDTIAKAAVVAESE